MDLAFVAANYRFTQTVQAKMYRAGLANWPLDPEWLGAKTDGGSADGVAHSVSGGAGASSSGSIPGPAGDVVLGRTGDSAACETAARAPAVTRATAGFEPRATVGVGIEVSAGPAARRESHVGPLFAPSAAAVAAFTASLASSQTGSKKT